MSDDSPRWADLFLMLSVFFGAIVRFAPTFLAHSPINDGGMFYAMMGDLRANGFLLPASTTYNHLNIPFAYPPLSLYAGAMLSTLGIPTIEVVRWLPPLISTLSILSFFWMATVILSSRTKGSLAAAIYALMPRSFSWYVMGGGLSRSFGILFLLLACGSAWLMFFKPDWRRVALTGLFGAGSILSHPETGLHTLAVCLLVLAFKGRSRRTLRDAALVALVTVALTSPWWATVIAQHGLAPFVSALQTGAHNSGSLIPWLTLDFAQEPFVTILSVLGLIGVAVQCIRRQWFLPAWMLVAFIAEPRSAPAIAALPLAMLAACGMTEFLLPKLAVMQSDTSTVLHDWTQTLSCSPAARIATGFVLLYSFFGAFAYDLSLAGITLPPESRTAMEWVGRNTPAKSRFVVLSGAGDPFSDASAEWFPVLTGRSSVNTLQGREWLLGKSFMPFLQSLTGLETCLSRSSSCVEQWSDSWGIRFDYLYIEDPQLKNHAEPSRLLLYHLQQDSHYKLVFENAGTAIFQRK